MLIDKYDEDTLPLSPQLSDVLVDDDVPQSVLLLLKMKNYDLLAFDQTVLNNKP